MKILNLLNKYKYAIFVAVLAILWTNHWADSHQISLNKPKEKPSSLKIDNYNPLDDNIVALASVFSSLSGQPFQPTSNPLYNISREFKDINLDGKKEWITRENWQGASGWSDKYSFYQINGLKITKLFDLTFENSVTYFDNGQLYRIEPYYEEDMPRAYVDKLLVTKYEWVQNNFQPIEQEIYPINNNLTGSM